MESIFSIQQSRSTTPTQGAQNTQPTTVPTAQQVTGRTYWQSLCGVGTSLYNMASTALRGRPVEKGLQDVDTCVMGQIVKRGLSLHDMASLAQTSKTMNGKITSMLELGEKVVISNFQQLQYSTRNFELRGQWSFGSKVRSVYADLDLSSAVVDLLMIRFPSLNQLECSPTAIIGLRCFQFFFCNSGATDVMVQSIAKYSYQLRSVSISYSPSLTDIGVKAFADNHRNLSVAHFRCCPGVTDAGIQSLDCWKLNIWECSGITDEGIQAFVINCKGLQQLEIFDCPHITEEGMQAVMKLRPDLQVDYRAKSGR